MSTVSRIQPESPGCCENEKEKRLRDLSGVCRAQHKYCMREQNPTELPHKPEGDLREGLIHLLVHLITLDMKKGLLGEGLREKLGHLPCLRTAKQEECI